MPISAIPAPADIFGRYDGAAKGRHRTNRGERAVATEADTPIIHYDAERIPDDRPGAGAQAAEQFWEVRNAVVAVCRRHGSVGPDDRELGTDHGQLVYWVVDDQYNEERYQYTEVYQPQGMTQAWLRDLMSALLSHPYWGVAVNNILNGYLLVFADRLMVTGPAFEGCQEIGQLVARAQRAIEISCMVEAVCDDPSLERLSQVPDISQWPLVFRGLENVTDAGCIFISRMPSATVLSLNNSRITDQGLSCLRSLPNLRNLSLRQTRISDMGLVSLRELRGLRDLDLYGCAIHDTALASLQGLNDLERLELARTGITDAGLAHLRGLRKLRRLSLADCRVGDQGLTHLEQLTALPLLDLDGTEVTSLGLAHLRSLYNLRELRIGNTRVALRAVELLAKELPNCWIEGGEPYSKPGNPDRPGS